MDQACRRGRGTWSSLLFSALVFALHFLLALSTSSSVTLPAGEAQGFYTLEQIHGILQSLHDAAPEWVSPLQNLGDSVEQRKIWAVCIGVDGCKSILTSSSAAASRSAAFYHAGLLVVGMHHAREPLAANSMLRFGADLVNRLADSSAAAADPSTMARLSRLGGGIWLVPCANPDAYQFNLETIMGRTRRSIMARKNRRPGCGGGGESTGVDTNRNYDFYWSIDDVGSNSDQCAEDYRGSTAFSEPESKAVAALVEKVPLTIALNLHSYGRFINLPYGVQRLGSPPQHLYSVLLQLAQNMADVTGFGYGHPWSGGLYSVNGEASDWMFAKHGVLAVSPELGPFFDYNPFEKGMWPDQGMLPSLIEEAAALIDVSYRMAGPMPRVLSGASSLAAGSSFAPGSPISISDLSVENVGASDFMGSLHVAALPPDDKLLQWTQEEVKQAVEASAGAVTLADDAEAAALGAALSTTWQELLQLKKLPKVSASKYASSPPRPLAPAPSGRALIEESRVHSFARTLKQLEPSTQHLSQPPAEMSRRILAASAAAGDAEGNVDGQRALEMLQAGIQTAPSTGHRRVNLDTIVNQHLMTATEPQGRLLQDRALPVQENSANAPAVSNGLFDGVQYPFFVVAPAEKTIPALAGADLQHADAVPAVMPPSIGVLVGGNDNSVVAEKRVRVVLPPTFKTKATAATFNAASSGPIRVNYPTVPLSAEAKAKQQQAGAGGSEQVPAFDLAGVVVVSDDLTCWVFGVSAEASAGVGGKAVYGDEPLLVMQASTPLCAALRSNTAGASSPAPASALLPWLPEAVATFRAIQAKEGGSTNPSPAASPVASPSPAGGGSTSDAASSPAPTTEPPLLPSSSASPSPIVAGKGEGQGTDSASALSSSVKGIMGTLLFFAILVGTVVLGKRIRACILARRGAAKGYAPVDSTVEGDDGIDEDLDEIAAAAAINSVKAPPIRPVKINAAPRQPPQAGVRANIEMVSTKQASTSGRQAAARVTGGATASRIAKELDLSDDEDDDEKAGGNQAFDDDDDDDFAWDENGDVEEDAALDLGAGNARAKVVAPPRKALTTSATDKRK